MLTEACPFHSKQHDHRWILLTAAQTQNNTQQSLSFFFAKPGGFSKAEYKSRLHARYKNNKPQMFATILPNLFLLTVHYNIFYFLKTILIGHTQKLCNISGKHYILNENI